MASMTVVSAVTNKRVGVVHWFGTDRKGTFAFEPIAQTDAERKDLELRFASAVKAQRADLERCLFMAWDHQYVNGFEGYWGTASALRIALTDVMLDIDWNANDPPPASEPWYAPESERELPVEEESTATV